MSTHDRLSASEELEPQWCRCDTTSRDLPALGASCDSCSRCARDYLVPEAYSHSSFLLAQDILHEGD
jgi:hypothetical protein